MLNPQSIAVVLIAAFIVLHFFGFKVVLYLAGLGILIAIGVLVSIIIKYYHSHLIKNFKNKKKGVLSKYQKFESKIFNWIDSL